MAFFVALIVLPLALVVSLPPRDVGGPIAPPQVTVDAPYLTHTVRTGDTLTSIAARHETSVAYLVASNTLLDTSTLSPGQELIVPRGGVVHTVRSGQTWADIARTYQIDERNLRRANASVSVPLPGERVFVPFPTTIPQARALELGLGGGGRFNWPLRGRISSPFGWRTHPISGQRHMHLGIDIAIPEGTPVHASAPGQVTTAGWSGAYGILVVLEHEHGYSTYYAHLSRTEIYVGQYVERGQVIGLSGNTGMSTGPHLHFEIRQHDVPIDPLTLLP